MDPLNHTDMYCIHFVFLPRIEKHLKEFQESWNHHSLSTENNRSPYQLFLLGAQNETVDDTTLIYPTAPLPSSLHVTQHVAIPRSKFVPCTALLRILTQNINPLQQCDDFGYGLYLEAVQIVQQHLLLSCSACGIID